MYIGLYRTQNKAFSCLVLSYLRGAGGFVEDQWYMSKEVSCRNHPYISSQYLRRAKSRSSETKYDQPLIYPFVTFIWNFEITDDPCNPIGSQQCDIFTSNTIYRSKSRVLIRIIFALRACLHGGEVNRGGSPHLLCKCDQIKTRDHIDRWGTQHKWVTSLSWGAPPPYKQALNGITSVLHTKKYVK